MCAEERTLRGTCRTAHNRQANAASSFFWSLWSFIGGVSLYDAWLVVLTRNVILSTEQNVICWHLINLEPMHLSLFLAAKAAGTLIVLAILGWLHLHSHRHTLTTSSGVATFQFGLLMYLNT